jgi:hypothetical protein
MTPRSKYGAAKRLLNAIGGREALANGFCHLPDAISPHAYRLARRFVFRDNGKRLAVFEAAFTEASRRGNLGDYLEFGVARGTSLISAYETARSFGVAMRFHAFDSFEGLPASEGDFVAGDMSYPEAVFRRFVHKAGVRTDALTTTAGFFDKSLSTERADDLEIQRGKAHVVHVDCDLYSSTVPVLDFIGGFLGVGSVVIFDDWFSFEEQARPWEHGEQRAFAEWPLRDRFEPLAITYPWNAAFKMAR